MKHGASAYRRGACRCLECTEDHRQRRNREMAARRGAADTPHGTWTAYLNWGCRCLACTEAQRLYNGRNRARRRGEARTALEAAGLAIELGSPVFHPITGRDGRA